MNGATIKIRWHLELVGDVASPLLRQDRQVRASLTATDRLQRKLAKAAVDGAREQARGTTVATAAIRGEGEAVKRTLSDVDRLNRAQAEAVTVGGRLAASARRVADSYRAQTNSSRRAREETTRLQRAQARAQAGVAKAGSSLAGGVALGRTAAAGGLATAAIAGTTGLVAAERSVMGFDQTIDAARAKLLITAKAMTPLRQAAIDLGAKTSFSAKEAAGAIDELAAQGFSANKILAILPGTLSLAAASGTDLANAAAIQTETLHGFGLAARDAGKVADVLAQISNRSAAQIDDLQESLKYIAPVAKASGQSLEDMGAAIGIMANVGIKGSQAGTTLRTAMVRLANPTDKARSALGTLHLKASDLAGPKGLLSLPNILGKIATGAEGVSKNQRNAALATIFGREALSGMVALVEKGAPAIEREADALRNSEGAAKRAAGIMRNNVSGAWDNFTGSVNSASIALLERFQPALKDTLNQAASGVNRGGAFLGDFLSGLAGTNRGGRAGAAGKGTSAFPSAMDPDRMAAVKASAKGTGGTGLGQRARGLAEDAVGIAKGVGRAAAAAGGELLDAFKPALPFFQNILLPLLKGVGEGVLISIAGAFKVVVPIIGLLATGLGKLGTWAKPLRPIFEGIGLVVGVVFSGPILKGIGLLGKLGGVFRLLGPAAKIAYAPIGLLSGGIRLVGAGVARLVGPLTKGAGLIGAGFRLLLIPIRLWVTAQIAAVKAVVGVFSPLATRLIGPAVRAVSGVGRTFGGLVSKVVGPVGRAVTSAGRAFTGVVGRLIGIGRETVHGVGSLFGALPSTIANAVRGKLGDLGAFFTRVGKSIVRAVVSGIRGAPGAITGAVGDLIPGPLKGAAHKLGLRRGGLAYQDGGLVGAYMSPGELVTYGDGSWTVPGARTAADSVFTMVPAGAAVWTGDGQARLARGEDPASVLRSQAPHFATGGIVPGRYDSTAYGPPWTGINGRGVTAAGVDLRPARRYYGVATDPSRIPTGSGIYAWPNPFGFGGRFRAFDTGSAIKGNRLDFYDWRGRGAQMRWGHRDVRVSSAPIHGNSSTYTAAGGSGATPGVSIMRASRRRSALVPDALMQGVQAGQEGLLRSRIRQDGSPIFDSIRDALASTTTGKKSKRATGRGSASRWDRRHTMAWARAFASQQGLRMTSSWRSKAHNRQVGGVEGSIHTQGTRGNPHAFDFVPPKASALAAAKRISPRPREAMIHNAGSGLHLHVGLFRRGGLVGARLSRFRGGGTVGPALTRGLSSAMTFKGGSLEGLDSLIGNALEAKLDALRTQVLARVRAGGPQRVIQRLQAVLTLIDFEVGRRIGRIDDTIQRRTGQITTRGDQNQRDYRRFNIDPESSQGLLGDVVGAGVMDIPALQANVKSAKSALNRAKKTGNTALIRTETQQLADAQAALDEAQVSQIERWRKYLTVRAQEAVDATTHSLSLAQGNSTALATSQRLSGLAQGSPLLGEIGGTMQMRNAAREGSPEALRQQAGQILSDLMPALQSQRGALEAQLAVAQQLGDVGGIRAAELALQQNGNDLATAVADAAEALRNAAIKAAQDLVDATSHSVSLAQGRLTALDTGQRLAGLLTGSPIGAQITGVMGTLGLPGVPDAADTPAGMRARADAIQTNLLPALQSQRGALQNQLATAQSLGDTDGIRSAELALQQNANDLATAVGDAAQALRDASVQAAQDVVDQTGHTTNLANAGLQRLELEQKLNGTYEGGGAARADYINSQVIPALQGELAAITAEQETFRSQGMTAELRAAIEAGNQKQNDILEASLEAQEAIEANTQPDRSFGGSLAFGYGGDIVTDSIVNASLGI